MKGQIMHRLVRSFAVLVFVAFGAGTASAQDATPSSSESLLAGQGFPELTVTANDDGLVDAPTSIDAGRYLITFENTGGNPAALDFVGVADGTTYDAVAELYATANSGDSIPDEVYDTPIAGGVRVAAGESDQVIVDLTPGAWVIGNSTESDDSGNTMGPKTYELTVTGTFPTVDVPTTDVEVGMFEMGFDMPDQIGAGPAVWSVTNTGDQPHFIELARYPTPFTERQILSTFEFVESDDPGATPAADALDPQDLELVFGSEILSPGMTNWLEIDLEPGYYVALCFIPDQATGIPHTLMGMIKVFEVT